MKSINLSNLLLSLISFLFIISISVVITLNFRPLYYFDIGFLDIPTTSGMSKEEIKENYDALIDYNSCFYQGELEFPTLSQSEEGRIHFVEVKEIFVCFQYMAIVCFLILVPFLILQSWKHDFQFLKLAGILTLIIPTILGIAIALYWDKVFVLFHKLVFDNDYWIFDPAKDPVIRILPDTFFMHCASMITILVILGAVGCLLIYRKLHTHPMPTKHTKPMRKGSHYKNH